MYAELDGWKREQYRKEYHQSLKERLQAQFPRNTEILLHLCGTYTKPQCYPATVIDVSALNGHSKQINLTKDLADLLDASLSEAEETGKRGLCWYGVFDWQSGKRQEREGPVEAEFIECVGQVIWDDPHAYTYRILPEWHGYDAEFLDQTWCDVGWSPWVPFDQSHVRKFVDRPGIYRLKETGQRELFYIGYSMRRSLRNYLIGLHHFAFQEEMPHRVASLLTYPVAPALWTWHDAEQSTFECSVAPLPEGEDHTTIYGVTCGLLWTYRHEMHTSPTSQFGRFHAHYTAPVILANRNYIRGTRLPEGESNPASLPSYPALLHMCAERTSDSYWMSLRWSGGESLVREHIKYTVELMAKKPPATGVYRIHSITDKWNLMEVGWTRDIYRTMWDKSWISSIDVAPHYFEYTPFDRSTPDHHLREVVNDVIGGYFAVTHTMPLTILADYML